MSPISWEGTWPTRWLQMQVWKLQLQVLSFLFWDVGRKEGAEAEETEKCLGEVASAIAILGLSWLLAYAPFPPLHFCRKHSPRLWPLIYLSYGFYGCHKDQDQKQLGVGGWKDWFQLSTFRSGPSLREVMAGAKDRYLEAGTGEEAMFTGLLLLACLVCKKTNQATFQGMTFQGMVLPKVG